MLRVAQSVDEAREATHDRPAHVRRRARHAARRPRRVSAAPSRRRKPRPNGKRSPTACSSRCARYDEKHQTELVRTLRLFFDVGQNIKVAAASTQRAPPHRILPAAADRGDRRARPGQPARSTHAARGNRHRCSRQLRTAHAARREISKPPRTAGVTYVRLAFVDISGIEKNITIPVSELERALNGHVTFDGGSIDGFVRGEETRHGPAPGSGDVRDPALDASNGAAEARMLVRHRDARRHAVRGLPAHRRSNACSKMPSDVFRGVRTALEVEFYLFNRQPDGTPTTRTLDDGSYFDFSPSRSRRRSAHRDRRRARSDGHRRVERAPRTRRRSARIDLSAAGALATADRSHHRARHRQAHRGRATTSTRPSCPSRSKRRPEAGCTSTS